MDVENIENFTLMFKEIMNLEEHINVDKLIQDLDGEVEEHNESFVIISKGGENTSFVITLPTLTNISERKYLLAHSIGHLLIHMNYLLDDDSWNDVDDYYDSAHYRQGHNIENYEADAFAMELLLGRKSFFRIAKENLIDGVYKTEEISKHFEVPTRYVIERGRKVGLFAFGPN